MANNRIKLVVLVLSAVFMLSFIAGCKGTKNVYDAASDYVKVNHNEDADYSPFDSYDADNASKDDKSTKSGTSDKTDSADPDTSPEKKDAASSNESASSVVKGNSSDPNSTDIVSGEIVGEVDENSGGKNNYGPVVTF